MNDDRQPTIHIEGHGKLPLDEVVAMFPVLAPFAERGITYKRSQPAKPIGDGKPG